MRDLDLLIEIAVTSAEIEAGVPKLVVQSRTDLPLSCIAGELVQTRKAPEWTEDEDNYLKAHLGSMEEAEIAKHLGRSQVAVHLRWFRDLCLPAPSKHPDYLTAERIARLLGEDCHKVVSWIDRGMLQGEILPGSRRIRRVRKDILLAWLLTPENWIWFDVHKCRDPRLYQQITEAQKTWGDEWWTTRQVADYHRVDVTNVKRYIKLGHIRGAVQARNMAGRDRQNQGCWAFWFVRKSEATRPDLVFRHLAGKQKL